MSDLTEAQKEAYARANSGMVHLRAVELIHSAFPLGYFRFVGIDAESNISLPHESSAPLNAGQAVSYTPIGASLKEPVLSDEPDSSLTFQIDNVSGIAEPYVAAAVNSQESIIVMARYYQFDTKTNIQHGLMKAIQYQVRNVDITLQSLSFSAGRKNPVNQSFPGENYTPLTNPGLVQ